MDLNGVSTRVARPVWRVRVTSERDESALVQPSVTVGEVVVRHEPGLPRKVGSEAVAPAEWPPVDDADPASGVRVDVFELQLGGVTV